MVRLVGQVNKSEISQREFVIFAAKQISWVYRKKLHYQHTNLGDKFFTRCDLAEQFPFLAAKAAPYYGR